MLMKKIAAVAACALMAAAFVGCEGTHDDDAANISIVGDESGAETTVPADIQWKPDVDIHNFNMPEIGEKIAVITVKDYGVIKIKLFPEDAPKGVENFIGLAEMGYYDELIFHRVIPNFMIQGGDPKGNGTGGKSLWGDAFDGETSENLYHFTGAVAYAHPSNSFTNSSQFYIVNTPDGYMDSSCAELYSYNPEQYNWAGNVAEKYNEVGGVPFLDGGYTIFGQVFEGMDVVRAIAAVETDQDPNSETQDKPLTQVLMESVRIEEYQG